MKSSEGSAGLGPVHGSGPRGECICVRCGMKAPHVPGTPCRGTKCPRCGIAMVREGSEHHLAFLKKIERKGPEGET